MREQTLVLYTVSVFCSLDLEEHMRKHFSIPGSRTLFALILVLAMTLLSMGITVFASEEEVPAENAPAAIEETADEEPEYFCGLDEHTHNADCTAEPAKPMFYGTVLSLLPPVIAIVLALITKEVYSSLFIGILAGGLLAADFSPIGTIDSIIGNGFVAAIEGSAGIFMFLVLLGVLVALLNKTGASRAFGKWAQKNIKTRIGAMLATFLLGVLIFIDDYFNCLTVGSVMLPVTDSHKVSRAKLSYLIDATAAPVCMIAPISSWAAAVSDYAAGTGHNGLSLFIRAIPYNFYSLLTLGFIIMITLMKFDYGPMAVHERNALEKGDLFTSGTEHDAVNTEQGSERSRVFDLILPIAVLIVITVLAIIYSGGFFSGTSFVDSFAGTDVLFALPWGGVVALVIALIYLICRRIITFKEAMECIPEGFKAMVPAILILTFATTLKNMTGLLGSDTFVETIMKNAAGLELFLPAIIFIVACFISFSTGTSWGTFGILIPIVTAIFTADSELMYIGMSACLAGAVCGDHCSPISDTTIMSSAGARCDHINHVSTQLPYTITVAAVSFVCYIVTSILQLFLGSYTWLVTLPMGAVLLFAVLFIIKKKVAPKA